MDFFCRVYVRLSVVLKSSSSSVSMFVSSVVCSSLSRMCSSYSWPLRVALSLIGLVVGVSPWQGLPSMHPSLLLPFPVAIPSSIVSSVEGQTVANRGTCDFGTNVCVSLVLAYFLVYLRKVHRGHYRLRYPHTYSTLLFTSFFVINVSAKAL